MRPAVELGALLNQIAPSKGNQGGLSALPVPPGASGSGHFSLCALTEAKT